MLDYRIITKEEYKKIRLNSVIDACICKGIIKEIDKNWNALRKGYDFVIAAGREEKPMLYSVPYFNENILCGNKKSKGLIVKLNIDTEEVEDKLNRIEKKLERIKDLKALNEINNLTINNDVDIKNIMKRCVEAVMSMEPLQ